MTDEIDRVIAKLKEAQRELVKFLPADGSWHEWPRYSGGPLGKWPSADMRGFGKSGLVKGRYGFHDMAHRLTDKGLAVRARLQERADG